MCICMLNTFWCVGGQLLVSVVYMYVHYCKEYTTELWFRNTENQNQISLF